MKTLLATVAVVFFATSAYAQTEYATVIRVKPIYENVRVPNVKTQCRMVTVPIYGEERFDQGSAIVGGIVGGVIGNQFGGGSGKDVATGLGAITGAIIGGNKPATIVGYRQETRCEDIIFYEDEERIKNYSITYEWNGVRRQGYSLSRYQIGDKIPINISLNSK